MPVLICYADSYGFDCNMNERLHQVGRRPRESEPEGRSFEERPSGAPAAFVTKRVPATFVIPAKAGIQRRSSQNAYPPHSSSPRKRGSILTFTATTWIPAFAGMTVWELSAC